MSKKMNLLLFLAVFFILSCHPEAQSNVKPISSTITPKKFNIEAKIGSQSSMLNATSKSSYFVTASTLKSKALSVERGMGTVIWEASENEYVLLTSHHIVEGAQNISVSLWADGQNQNKVFPARIVALDPVADLALLSFFSTDQSIVAKMDFVDNKIGTRIFAFGQPAMNLGVVTMGIVSGFWRVEDKGLHIVSDILTTEGFSGGGVFNNAGCLIGVVSGKTADKYRGFAYILPIERVVPLLWQGVGSKTQEILKHSGTMKDSTSTSDNLKNDLNLRSR